jgi:acetyl coenzyme A synthetase (ADP forming)-like protein
MESKQSDLNSVFSPKTIAVIGASKTRGKFGREVIRNLLNFDFEGIVFPVNPSAHSILSMKCYRSILDISDEIDLAIIVVTRDKVLKAVEDCGKKKVKTIIIITAGFREIGHEGEEMEKQILSVVKEHGMRAIGPNCMGVINTDPEVRLNATFAGSLPLRGNVSFLSQSGALGVAIIDFARKIGIGLAKFVSIGNRIDISVNDLLEYWRDDPLTDVILLYLESFGNPRKFTQIARDTSRTKPVIAVKAGRTLAGARAASSHTGALASGLDVATDALFEQCGVMRANSIEEVFDLAKAFSSQPLPRGNRVGILTNAGGPGILTTDACVYKGLQVPELSRDTQDALKALLPLEASTSNPVDIIASATAETYRKALPILLGDPQIDTIIIIYVAPMIEDIFPVSKVIAQAVKEKPGKTVLACLMGREDNRRQIEPLTEAGIPTYIFPESVARAIHAMNWYREWKEKDPGRILQYEDVDTDAVKKILEQNIERGIEYLSGSDVDRIFKAYGIPMARSILCTTVEEVAQAAEEIGYPVAMKIAAPGITHKSDMGGVIVDLKNELEVRGAFSVIKRKHDDMSASGDGFSVQIQEMVKGGQEIIAGVVMEPSFGPLIMFGLGGIYVEVLKDVSFRICPLTDIDAHEMIHEIKGYPILKGMRGKSGISEDTIVDLLGRVSQLISDFHCICELDINPFMIFPEARKCKAVDGRLRITGSVPRSGFE